MKRLLLLMGDTPEAPLRWWQGEEKGPARSGSVPSLMALPSSFLDVDHLCVILPGEQAATRRLILPLKRDAALEAAARLAFEDVLAAPAEEFHFAFGPSDDTGIREVSAVPKTWMKDWFDALDVAGLQPDLVTLDHLVIRGEGTDGVILHEGDRVVLRLSEGGMSLASSFAATLIPSLEGIDSVQNIEIEPEDEGGALGAFYASSLARQLPATLMRGAYRRRQDWGGLVRQWRSVAALVAACMIVWLGGLMTDGMRHSAAARNIEDEAIRMFSEAFPGTPVRDLSRQAAARAQVNGAPMFLPLSAELTAAMEDTISIELTSLSYQAGQGVVADLRFPDAASLESLREKLETQGVTTREGGNIRREDDGRYVGQLLLEGVR